MERGGFGFAGESCSRRELRISKSGGERGHINLVQAMTPLELVMYSLKMVIPRHVN